MDATIQIKICPRDAVPTEGRVEWLEAHGVPPQTAIVSVTAPLATWARIASIQSDGTVGRSSTWNFNYEGRLTDIVLARIRATGIVAETLSASDVEAVATAREREVAEAKAKEDAETQARRAEENAKVEQMIERALALPISGWVRESAICRAYSFDWVRDLRVDADPRIVAYREKLESELPTFLAARDRAKNECIAALRELASHEDDLARPAAEKYPVEQAMLDRLALRMKVAVDGAHTQIDKRSWGEQEDRNAPSAEAFALYDRVLAAARAQNETFPIAVGRWQVSRIVRLDVCPHQREVHHVTAVFATLDTETGLREVTYSTESLACAHSIDDEGDDQ
jgi:hypothetical protein